jgi:hypothetical protein
MPRFQHPIARSWVWAKKEAGKPIVQPQLPARSFGQSDLISLRRDERRTYAEADEDLLRTEAFQLLAQRALLVFG